MVDRKLKVLVTGGSGFVSGSIAAAAQAAGHEVTVVTRGRRPVSPRFKAIVADRAVPGEFQRALAAANQSWDWAVDCIGFDADHARQDLEALTGRAGRLVFISTDFVHSPVGRSYPLGEHGPYAAPGSYGGKKRAAEEVLAAAGGALPWTILRPGHIYGPGSLLGCFPAHSRDAGLIARLRAGEALRLVDGGVYLLQPIYAPDLARLIFSCASTAAAAGQIYSCPGPETVSARDYYQIIADVLAVPLRVESITVAEQLAAQPDSAAFLCHRLYSAEKMHRHGLALPETPLRTGLAAQIADLQRSA